jgi:Mn-containing catalase
MATSKIKEQHEYAQLILDDYAGKVSETTAIMQYIHHHMEMETIPSWQEVSDLEKGISIVEMLHMEMLGEIIIHLGASPCYYDGRQQPWTPQYIAYHNFNPCASATCGYPIRTRSHSSVSGPYPNDSGSLYSSPSYPNN